MGMEQRQFCNELDPVASAKSAFRLLCTAALVLGIATAAGAQTPAVGNSSLPDAPKPHGGTTAVAQSTPLGKISPLRNPVGGPNGSETYQPITATQRIKWIVTSTLGPADLAAGVLVAGLGTAIDKPPEDGPHWSGFAERYGIRLTGVATSDTMEAGLGALWGEDPRYSREPERSFSGRMKSVIVQTFETSKSAGNFSPAYARFIAIPGSNFLSNTWRPDSEADSYHAGLRTIEGFGSRLISNAWDEFWPSAKARLLHKHSDAQR